MKNYLLGFILVSVTVLHACTSANADADLEWEHNSNGGEAVNHIDGEVENIQHTPQEAVDKLNSLYEGAVVEVELDKDDGVYYYEIEIVNGSTKYESKINADNLEIIKLEKGTADSDDGADSAKQLTPEAAFDIAAGEAGGEVLSWELEDNEYEVLMEVDDKLIKVEIDALTAEVVGTTAQNDERSTASGAGGTGEAEEKKEGKSEDEEKEQKSSRDMVEETSDEGEEKASEEAEETVEVKEQNTETSQDSGGLLTPQEAMNIALHTVGGIVIEWEYDDDDFEYEIELIVNGQEVEVEIDSRDGAVLDVDYD